MMPVLMLVLGEMDFASSANYSEILHQKDCI